jgi:hypothetical protein
MESKLRTTLVITLLALVASAHAAEMMKDIMPAPDSVIQQETADLAGIPPECKNLARVGDIDDLLYQLYSNIDSYCLFEIPADRLETIWGIPVLDFLNADDRQRAKLERRLKDEIKDQGLLYVEREMEKADRVPSLDIQFAYSDSRPDFGGSLTKGTYPQSLPEPATGLYGIDNGIYREDPEAQSYIKYNPDKKELFYSDLAIFWFMYWTNPDCEINKPVLYMSAFEKFYIYQIRFYKMIDDKTKPKYPLDRGTAIARLTPEVKLCKDQK